MKKAAILSFLLSFCTASLYCEVIGYAVADADGLLSQTLKERLQESIENVLRFITPFDPEPSAADNGAAYSLTITVAGGGQVRETEPAMIAYSFRCEIFPGSSVPSFGEGGGIAAGTFFLECAGAGPGIPEAESALCADFENQLRFAVMYEPLLRRDICVLHMFGKDAVLSLPRKWILKPGMELDMSIPGQGGGRIYSGRLVVREISEEYAVGRMLFEEKPLSQGAVGEWARTSGFGTGINAGILIKSETTEETTSIALNAVYVRIIEELRLPSPWFVLNLGVQVPFFMESTGYAGRVPFTVLLGVTIPWFQGKARLYSMLAGGIGTMISEKVFYYGLLTELGFELKLGKAVVLSLSLGYTGWNPASGGFTFSGFLIGLGARVNY